MAFLPLIVALIMLVILRQSSLRAGLVTLATTLLIVRSVPAFFLAGSRLALATEQGVGASLTVLALLWPGLLLYHLIRGAGGFSVAARTLTRLCPDRDLRLLWLVLGVCPFLEAVSGLGLGIVVIVPLLTELGCDSAQAAMLGLVGQVTTTWGGMGVATLLGAQLSGLPAPILGARSALLLAPLSVSVGLLALVIGGGPRAVQRAFLPAILAGSLLALGEWAWSQFPGVDLAGLLASLSVMTGLWLWGWSRGCRTNWRHRLAEASHAHAHGSSILAGKGAQPSPGQRNVGYICQLGHQQDGEDTICQSMTARPVDAAVVQVFLEAVSPVGVEVAVRVLSQVEQQLRDLRRQWELQLEQARYEARLAQRKYDAVDPDNRLVAAELERRWNAQLTRVAELEQAYAKVEQEASFTLTPEERAAMQRLAQDLLALWQAETTTHADRKQLLRLAVESVQLDGVSRPGWIEIQICWRSGMVTRLDVKRVQRGEWSLKTPAQAVARIHELAADLSYAQIAEELNAEGWRTAFGRPFTSQHVGYLCRRDGCGRKGPRTLGDADQVK